MIERFVTILILTTIWTSSLGQVNHRWQIQKMNWELGFIDSQGNERYTDKFDILDEDYNSGLVFFKKGKKRGFLDENGKIVFVSKYAWGKFSEGLLGVKHDKSFYYLNSKGVKVIALDSIDLPKGKEISFISDFHNGLALTRIQDIGTEDPNSEGSDVVFAENVNLYPGNWFYGFINKEGKWAIPPKIESATSFTDGISIVEQDGISYFMDSTGVFVTKLDYKSVGEYSEGFAIVYAESNNNFFINKYGKRIGNKEFQRASKFSEGMAAIQLNDKWGYIDTTGTIVIEPQYFVPNDFSEGLVPVSLKVDEKEYSRGSYFIEAFIDKKGEIKVPFEKHVDYKGFINGLTKGRRFIYTDDNKYTGKYELFYMDKNGRKVWSEIVKQNR